MKDVTPYINTILTLLLMLGAGFGLGIVFFLVNKFLGRYDKNYDREYR